MSVSLSLVLQLALLMLAGFALPRLLARVLPWRLDMVLLNIGLSALLLWLGGALLLAAAYPGAGLWHSFRADPAGGIRWALGQGALPALAWAPLLLLSALGIAQKIAQNPANPPGRGPEP